MAKKMVTVVSDIKKPSVNGMSNMGHLGHFAQDKYIQQGHNDVKDIVTNFKSLFNSSDSDKYMVEDIKKEETEEYGPFPDTRVKGVKSSESSLRDRGYK